MTQQFPPPGFGPQPPHYGLPAPRKRRRWPWVFGGVVLLAVVIGTANSGDRQTTQNRPGVPSGVNADTWTPAPGGLTAETWTQQGNRWVAPGDAGTAATGAPKTTFGPGTYEVGVDIEPGKYKTQGGGSFGSCYWARLKNTDGDFGSIIANGNTEGPATVTIKAGDGAFETTCATWTKS